MLPTIQFVGDIWLVETGAWRRAWRSLWKSEQNASVDISSYQVGDLVLWKDSRTGRISCKRIVGLEGDRVKTYGQFVELYSNRPDLGIVWPSDAAARGLSSKETFLEGIRQIKKIDSEHSIEQIMMVVPENHLWVEGDCPLFSVDSRHYGPIPTTTLEGRLVMRLWPWTRQEMVYEKQNSHFSSCWISRTRPVPYASEESYLGKKFGFYRVPKVGSETSLRPS
ncbi:signal peptidase I [Nitzschia inconspicua]|uniref:Mitochondrial inner membrane protease subunit n=1 Tax=Nitzschia inconspicua TaxID=303405 RepID=A0A9K3Q0P7_9STRA|nr:signal peptidase I [Nitzschia inconspicua]